ncbi:MAG TPA: bifunctional isocitrate dehydrogenase kinase/phosphatase [Calditrichia bacterium]|nr:bifunctional isocitrate dehydrogenase kinase/phosphatase [Calditrichia bacterium]
MATEPGGADIILRAFNGYMQAFQQITRRAERGFQLQNWAALQEDSRERLGIYRKFVEHTKKELRAAGLQSATVDKLLWAGIKKAYAWKIAARPDRSLAETYFNSITRQVFDTVGVDPQIEFVRDDFAGLRKANPMEVCLVGEFSEGVIERWQAILAKLPFGDLVRSPAREARRIAGAVDRHLHSAGIENPPTRVEWVGNLFYRGKWAFLVGRLLAGPHLFPLVVSFAHTDNGIVADAVLLDENEVSILFSFTRSYFHVVTEHPNALVRFLKLVMPRKRLAELYIAIGHNKHGKTEFYRDLQAHLNFSGEKFEVAPGKPGMVMTVLTLPGFNIVLKIIRDRFEEPKIITREAVKEKYHLVFKHDRGGRLADAQEFEQLEFAKHHFPGELITHLEGTASRNISLTERSVVIHHAYIERKMIPLDIFVLQVEEQTAIDAVRGYGDAIKELAASNIFPGDMLIKNFGVTRHGRVVFYDYDELSLLTDLNFREPPQLPSVEDLLAGVKWFEIAENDVFPSEMRFFLGLAGKLLEEFERFHGDIFQVAFWRSMQERIRSGEIVQILPYPPELRLDGQRAH